MWIVLGWQRTTSHSIKSTPVDEIEVHILELQPGKGVLECLAGLVWRMVIISQLGGDKDVFALYCSSLEHLLQAFANVSLVAIHLSSVDVLQVKAAILRCEQVLH